MKLRGSQTFMIVACMVVLGGLSSAADSWPPPAKERYCSGTAKYCVDIDPKPIKSALRYFDDHVQKRPNPGAGPGAPETASATLLVRDGRDYRAIRSFPLTNEVAPVHALVSSDGEHLVTFDNWHMVGWGDNVVVIYRNDGSVVKKYSLIELLSEKKVEKLPRTVSSIWWGGEHRLDERTGELVLQIVADGTKPFVENPKYTELRLVLKTGEKKPK